MVEVSVRGEILEKIVRGMNVLVSEARWHFNEDGLHIKAVDPANVAMVIVDVPDSAFEAYTVTDEEVIGVDLNRLGDVLKSLRKDIISVKTNDSKIVLDNGRIKYSLSLIDPSSIRREPKIPQLDLPAKIVLDAGEFKKIVNLAEKFSDGITLKSNEAFVIEAKGDVDEIKAEFYEHDLVEFNKAEAKSSFNVEYIKEFCKVADSGDLLTIHLGKDYPVRLIFENDFKIEYILAPRLEEEW